MAGYHTGIDYRASIGTPIFATKGGKVIFAGSGGSYGSAYGNYVVVSVKDGDRDIQCLYAHLSRIRVRKGQRVRAGRVLGLGGDTGNTFGPHLHYEERHAPFNYWSHRKPEFPFWRPTIKKNLKNIFKRIGLKPRK